LPLHDICIDIAPNRLQTGVDLTRTQHHVNSYSDVRCLIINVSTVAALLEHYLHCMPDPCRSTCCCTVTVTVNFSELVAYLYSHSTSPSGLKFSDSPRASMSMPKHGICRLHGMNTRCADAKQWHGWACVCFCSALTTCRMPFLVLQSAFDGDIKFVADTISHGA
jgi:hypothetical protein